MNFGKSFYNKKVPKYYAVIVAVVLFLFAVGAIYFIGKSFDQSTAPASSKASTLESDPYWVGKYYGWVPCDSFTDADRAGHRISCFDSKSWSKDSPGFTRNDEKLEFNWGKSQPGGDGDFFENPNRSFSAVWTRKVYFDGQYVFKVATDDGVKVLIDGKEIIHEWHPQSRLPEAKNGIQGPIVSDVIDLPAKLYDVEINYFQNAYDSWFGIRWEKVGGEVSNDPTKNITYTQEASEVSENQENADIPPVPGEEDNSETSTDSPAAIDLDKENDKDGCTRPAQSSFADLNNSKAVGIDDFMCFMNTYRDLSGKSTSGSSSQKSPCGFPPDANPIIDFNSDSKVDLFDYICFLNEYKKG